MTDEEEVLHAFRNWGGGKRLDERQAVLSGLSQTLRNVPFFAALAVGVAALAGVLGWVGTGIAAAFVAMLALFIAWDIWTLGLGLATAGLASGNGKTLCGFSLVACSPSSRVSPFPGWPTTSVEPRGGGLDVKHPETRHCCRVRSREDIAIEAAKPH